MNPLNLMYRQMILDHYLKPNAKVSASPGENYLAGSKNIVSCQDEITMFVELKTNILSDLKFSGHGCAISIAATDMMCAWLQQKDLKTAIIMLRTYQQWLQDQTINPLISCDHWKCFQTIHLQPTRLNCALLCAIILEDLLIKHDERTTINH